MKATFPVLILLAVFTNIKLFAQNYDSEVIFAELFTDVIERTGKVDYKRTLSLSFKSSGYLAKLNAYEGDYFSKGELLASLDVTELKETKNANYALLLQAKRDVKRTAKLLEQKLASQRDLDDAITQEETTRSAYQISYYNLEKSRLYAPFSGVVLSRNADLGELQAPGQEALNVAKLHDNLVVKVALTGREVSQVKLNQTVRVTLEQLGEIEGVVSKIPAMANPNGNLFTIEVLLPSKGVAKSIISGQLAAVKINFTGSELVYRLPIKALVAVNEQGLAQVVVEEMNSKVLKYESYSIMHIDNQFVYLKTDKKDKPLTIVTSGWHNLSIGER